MRRLAEINDLGPLSFRSVEVNDKAGPLDRVTARYVFARGSVIFESSNYRIERTTPDESSSILRPSLFKSHPWPDRGR
jgi:hypothetical protein